jgi:hypothetical protein
VRAALLGAGPAPQSGLKSGRRVSWPPPPLLLPPPPPPPLWQLAAALSPCPPGPPPPSPSRRLKFQKALVKRKSVVPEQRSQARPYGGEATGIKSKLSKSTRLG